MLSDDELYRHDPNHIENTPINKLRQSLETQFAFRETESVLALFSQVDTDQLIGRVLIVS